MRFKIIVLVLLVGMLSLLIQLQPISSEFTLVNLDMVDPRIRDRAARMASGLHPYRPFRWGQLDTEDLNEGDIVLSVKSKIQSTSEILIVSAPYDLNGKCRFNYARWEDGKATGVFIYSGSCADYGLAEYDGDPFLGWNKFNYVKSSSERSLSPAEMKEAIKDLEPEPDLQLPPPSTEDNA